MYERRVGHPAAHRGIERDVEDAYQHLSRRERRDGFVTHSKSLRLTGPSGRATSFHWRFARGLIPYATPAGSDVRSGARWDVEEACAMMPFSSQA